MFSLALTLVSLTLSLHAGQVAQRCSRRLPNTALSMNAPTIRGQALTLVQAHGLTATFAGDGTLVRVWSRRGRAPVCVRAVTWTRRARVLVRVTVGG